MMYNITYVSYVFTTNAGKEIEKVKEYQIDAQSIIDARYNFLAKKIKHKSIKSISEDNSNTIGNMFPGLTELKDSFKH